MNCSGWALSLCRKLFLIYTLGIRIGMVYTVHTAGRDQIYKPHVHLVMTKDGLIDGAWAEIESVPGARLSAKWRYLLCKRLRELRPSDTALQQVITKTYRSIAVSWCIRKALIHRASRLRGT
jgi:hypothetical protein